MFKKRWIASTLLGLWLAVGAWHVYKPMPAGTDLRTPSVAVAPQEVQFLYDLTYATPQGEIVREQTIFDETFAIIDAADSFIVADFFLFNSMMGAESAVYRRLSRELADRLIAKKRAQPTLTILLVTDPINDIYGGIESPLLDELRQAGIDVVVTDLTRLRDSNPAYSPWWRMLGQWWGNAPGEGSMPNPFDTGPTRITVRSWLALANFKANHRKLIVADHADGAHHVRESPRREQRALERCAAIHWRCREAPDRQRNCDRPLFRLEGKFVRIEQCVASSRHARRHSTDVSH
jgi:hypothetical protein